MTHPLTDEICLDIINSRIDSPDWETTMRAVADWQFEHVLEWFKNCRDYELLYITDRDFVRRELKKAMRPTQEDN